MATLAPLKPRKRQYKSIEVQPFPTDCKFIGYFTGLDVEVFDTDAIKALDENGSFGENSRPRQMRDAARRRKIDIATQDEYERKLQWREKFGNSASCPKKLLLVNDSKVEEAEDPFVICNSQVLCPEEAMFLHNELNCLEIRDCDDRILTTDEIWMNFCELKTNFPASYAAYVYLKSKNWVVKSGLKFGGHFLLYKQGPKYYHASYITRLIINGQRGQNEHQTNERVAENTKKVMVYLEIDFPADLDPSISYKNLEKFSICESAFQRYIAKRLNR